MIDVPVLFVDDEEDIRFSFETHFEGEFEILMAGDGLEALEKLAGNDLIGVVVTDIRMPNMDGLELIRKASRLYPNVSFVVVSGHGDVEDVITAMRLGARNYLRKPYNFVELEETINREAQRFRLLREESRSQENERAVDQFLISVNRMVFRIPSKMEYVTPLAFRLGRMFESVGVVDDSRRGNLVLAIIEIMNNAIEHGNLGITSAEKISFKTEGEGRYLSELRARSEQEPFKRRQVKISVAAQRDYAEVVVEDEGEGFDFSNLPDPTDPENIFLPSGRGVMLAKAFLDEVDFLEKGNIVRLIKRGGEPQS